MSHPQLEAPYKILKGVLNPADIRQLKKAYSLHGESSHLPCYAFLSNQSSPLLAKITGLVKESFGLTPYYLNDFFFYTSNLFSTPWHVDTEMFLFKSALNAWILLEPDVVTNPLGFIKDINGPTSPFFHTIHLEEGTASFVDLANTSFQDIPADDIENSHIRTPAISVGDILLLDPKRFHRTNTSTPKGACVFKFVFSDDNDVFLPQHLTDSIWPEIGVYKQLKPSLSDWPFFLNRVFHQVSEYGASSPLISGFYPDNFDYLLKRLSLLG